MNLDHVTSARSLPDDFNVIIEIPMNADPIKYEVDKDTGALFVGEIHRVRRAGGRARRNHGGVALLPAGPFAAEVPEIGIKLSFPAGQGRGTLCAVIVTRSP